LQPEERRRIKPHVPGRLWQRKIERDPPQHKHKYGVDGSRSTKRSRHSLDEALVFGQLPLRARPNGGD
jgi:hypothetical protein